MGSKGTRWGLCAAVAVLSLWGSLASAAVIIEDFSNAAIASYGNGPRIQTGTTLPGWEYGGRNMKIEQVGTDKVMSATTDYSQYAVALNLSTSGDWRSPVWVEADRASALNLSAATELQFTFVNRIPFATGQTSGLVNDPIAVSMAFWDASANGFVTKRIKYIAGKSLSFTTTQNTTTVIVDMNDTAITSVFDKNADLVGGFVVGSANEPNWTSGLRNRFANYSNWGSVALSSIAYTPEPATLVLLALGGLGLLRRRSR